jgi:hypothetical protein
MLLLTAAIARGQEPRGPSHDRIRDWDQGGSSASRAAEMANRLREAGLAPPPAQSIEPETIKKLLDMMERMSKDNPNLAQRPQDDPELAKKLADPEFRQQLERLRPDNAELQRQINDRNVDKQRFQDLLERMKQRAGGTTESGLPGGALPTPMPGVPQPSSTGTGGGATTPPRADTSTPGQEATGESASSPRDQVQAERFREFVKRLDRWMPKDLKDSDAVKRFTRRLGEMDWSKTGSKNILPERLQPNLDLSRRARGAGSFFDRTFGRLGNTRAPRMPNVSGPSLPRGPNLPSMGAPSAPSAEGAGGAFTVLMVLGGILVGAFLIWKLLVQPMQAKKEKPKEWELGNWPIDPSQVRTRQELIKAFDHLALLSGGKPARHWHHREVANRLGTPDEIRRVTADRLAMVYEQARYAPPQEPLPDAQIALARTDLVTLAGAGPS